MAGAEGARGQDDASISETHSWSQSASRLSAVRAFPAERLSQELGSEYSAFIQFSGTPQHDLYHAGQIVVLKKALSASRGAA